MPAARARTLRPKHSERLEIDVSQPAFDFSAAERTNSSLSLGARSLPFSNDSQLFHVAPLPQRRRAGIIDAALLLFAFGGFWSLFSAMGGHFTISSFSAVVTAATLSLLYAQYFSLFTYFGGATPGMMLCHLRVVSFDGSEPHLPAIAVAQLRLPDLRRHSSPGLRLGAVGRRSLNLARPHLPNLPNRGNRRISRSLAAPQLEGPVCSSGFNVAPCFSPASVLRLLGASTPHGNSPFLRS